jgi:hypothetical protein
MVLYHAIGIYELSRYQLRKIQKNRAIESVGNPVGRNKKAIINSSFTMAYVSI